MSISPLEEHRARDYAMARTIRERVIATAHDRANVSLDHYILPTLARRLTDTLMNW